MKSIILLIVFAITYLGFAQSLESQLKEKRESSKAPADVKAKMQKGVQELINSKLDEKAKSLIGKKIPQAILINDIGQPTPLSTHYKTGPLVLNFYRGGWCPYCMLELKAYQELMSEFKKAKVNFIAIAPDQYKEISKTRKKHGLTFTIYSDRNNELAKQLNLAFKVDKETIEIYKGFGIDLKAFQGNEDWMLPMPGVYVIDRFGTIKHIEVDPDYTKRAEPSKILEIAKSL